MHDLDQPFPQQFEYRNESDGDAHASFFCTKELHELDEGLCAHRAEDLGHVLAHGQSFAADVMVREHLRARHHVLQRNKHFLQRDVWLQPDDTALHQFGARRKRVAIDAVQLFDV